MEILDSRYYYIILYATHSSHYTILLLPLLIFNNT